MKKKPTKRKAVKKSTAIVKATPKKKSLVRQINNPEDVLTFGTVLKKFIVDNKLSVKIDNNDYAMVSAWQFAGISFGLTCIPSKPEAKHIKGEYVTTLYVEREFKARNGSPYKKDVAVLTAFDGDEVVEATRQRLKISKELTRQHYKYECKAEVHRLQDGSLVSMGTAVCTNAENNKSSFEEYAVASMAQTRAIGKAFRNLLGFVMKSAGYQETPAEEIEGVHIAEATVVEERKKSWINDFHFNQLKGRLKNEAGVMEKARELYLFTPEQEAEIKKVLNSKQ